MKTYINKYGEQFFSIFFIEVFLIAALRGTQAGFIFYLRDTLGIPEQQGYEYLSFLGILVYALPIIAGLISDKFLNIKSSMQLGMLMLIFGYLALSIPNKTSIIFALPLIGFGSGFFKPKLPILLDKLYPWNNPVRNNSFALYYSAANIGTILGTLICGWIGHQYGWTRALIIPLFFILCASGVFFKSRFFKLLTEEKIHLNYLQMVLVIIALIASLACLFLYGQLTILIIFTTASMIYLLHSVYKAKVMPIKSFIHIIGIIAFCIVFFIFYAQSHYSLNVFVDRYVSKDIFGFTIPTTWFLLIEPTCIIIGSLLLSFIEYTFVKKLTSRMALSSILLASAFYLFYISVPLTEEKLLISSGYVILAYILIASAELIIIPPTISKITKMFPESHKSSFMGLWFLSMAFAQYFAGILAKHIPFLGQTAGILSVTSFRSLFGLFSMSMFIISSLLMSGMFILSLKKIRNR